MSHTSPVAVPPVAGPSSSGASDVRQRLEGETGRKYWRSLGELAQDAEFSKRIDEHVRREYPSQAELLADPVQRRTLLQLMGASLALAGVSACTRQPDEYVLPYAKSPEALIPGRPLYFATAMPWASGAIGLLVESHMGRPTKCEGNPDHPASSGATDLYSQASVLDMYDPDRSTAIVRNGRAATWDDFVAGFGPDLEAQKAKGGAGLRILTGTVVSPTLAAQLGEVLKVYPKARWIQSEPITRDHQRLGALLAFAEDVAPRYELSRAEVVVALECDLLADGPAAVRLARQWAARRRDPAQGTRLYVVESSPTGTGSMADHRLALPPSSIDRFARALAQMLGVDVGASGGAQLGGEEGEFVAALAKDLKARGGKSVVVAGEPLSGQVHALVNAINVALGNVGATVEFAEPAAPVAIEQGAALADLAREMSRGEVELLIVIDANPVYDAPADLEFVAGMQKVPLRVHYGQREDETGVLCHWHVPSSHFLESWSDARAFDGTLSIVQPLIAPLYGSKSVHEFVAFLGGKAGVSGYDLLRESWKKRLGEANFESRWQHALHDGVLAGSRVDARNVSLKRFDAGAAPAPAGAGGEIELALRPDPSLYDGRFANNGWLQELPKPLSKLVWDNALYLSPETAKDRGLASGDVVEITHAGRKRKAAVWVQPGQAKNTGTLHLGFGRTRAGKVGNGTGFDAYALRTQAAPWGGDATLAKTGESYSLACAQEHFTIDAFGLERDLVRETTVAGFAAGDFGAPRGHHAAPAAGEGAPAAGHGEKPAHAENALVTQYAGYKYEGYAWGMVIDLTTCTGCNACVVACQAENNIPIVGKEQVARGREMHWIRIDRYFAGAVDKPHVVFQPIVCMQCENAPCEVVCPVGATSHGGEGLNEMVYNRCVGTKYCSNNCPYKVRRFNFLLYSDWTTPSLKLQRNPDVTVRARGVMEKCTYCIQRISQARIEAKREDRKIRDGEVVTACQQVCPSQAIVFGDLNDKGSAVRAKRDEPHNYGLLTELNTAPRTTYLARISNPNPELAGA